VEPRPDSHQPTTHSVGTRGYPPTSWVLAIRPHDVLDLLTSLVDRSLVAVEEAAGGGGGRHPRGEEAGGRGGGGRGGGGGGGGRRRWRRGGKRRECTRRTPATIWSWSNALRPSSSGSSRKHG